MDSYVEGEPCDAQMLTPGKAVAVASIPGEGIFDYCVACGHGKTFTKHLGGHGSIDTPERMTIRLARVVENFYGRSPSLLRLEHFEIVQINRYQKS